MATYTENYNLEKPAQSDLYNIDVFNENADKIDEALGDKAENQSLAPIESSSTASRNYSVGQQFVYNGLLYEATAAIASGGTITPGSNCARTTVAEELSALNDSLTNTMFDLTTTISGLRGRGIYTKATKSVRLFCHGNASSNITADTVLFNVPQGYRPAGLANGSMFFVTGSSGFGTADFHVYADGHCDQGTTNQLRTFIAVIEYPVLD